MVYIWLPLGYHVLLFSNYFVCTCFFMDVYHMIVIYLEIYTHEKCYIANWYPISLVSTSFMFYGSFGGSGKYLPYECLPFLLDLVHSFLSVVCVEMTCFAPCISFLWDYGDAQCSPMMYSYKRALLCHTHHLVESKSFKCSRIWIFCRSSCWCSTICLLQVLCLVLYTFSLAHVLCFKGLWGSEDSMLCTLYCNTNPYCARTLGSSLLIIRTLVIIFSYVQLVFFGSFDWILLLSKYLSICFSFAIFGSSI